MKQKLLNVAILVALIFTVRSPLLAQSGMIATPEQVKAMGGVTGPEVTAVLQKVWDNLGYAKVKTMQYVGGAGMKAAVGQQYSINDDWPRFQVDNYVRTTDYETGQTCEEYTEQQGPNYPPHGGGGTPLVGVHTWKSCVVGDYAWDVVDGKTIPRVNGHLYGTSEADFRKLDGVICTPIGFLKAAMAPGANPSMLASPAAQSPVHNAGNIRAIAIEALGKYRVVGMIDEHDTVEAVFTWIGNPFIGELDAQYRYGHFKEYNGVEYPINLHIHAGDGGISNSHNSQDFYTADIKWNVPVAPVVVPDEVKNAHSNLTNIESKKLADGVWLIGGSDLNSVAVEFKDYVAVIEAPENEQRSIAVIAEINKLIPNKPIKYVVNSSHHWDHAGGLRTYYTQGTTIITSESNQAYFSKVLFNYVPDRFLMPDRYAYYYVTPGAARAFSNAVFVNHGRYTLTDGDQTVELYTVSGPAMFSTEEKDIRMSTATRDVKQFDAVGMLVAYLPKSKILVNAELYKPEKPGDPPPPCDNNMTMLLQAEKSNHMNVSTVVSIDSPYVATQEQFEKTVGTIEPASYE